jgi:hypothetical protein
VHVEDDEFAVVDQCVLKIFGLPARWGIALGSEPRIDRMDAVEFFWQVS